MTHHRRGLRRLLKDDALLAEVEADWRNAPLGNRRQAMLEFAIKLTVQPGEMVKADLDLLRDAGYSDRDILDVVEVTAYYAYANRVADGLGLQPETWISEDD